MEIKIKELSIEDSFADLMELSKEFFYEYENNNKKYFEIDSIKDIDINNYFQNFIGNEFKKGYIALIENKIIGYITFYIKNQPDFYVIRKIGHISGLMVNKNYRKNGIGKKLIMESIKYFKQNNIKYYEVFTSVNNKNGISLYKKCGLNELYLTLYGEI